MHGIRRNVKMVYIIENNGVYGLTKGQISASADIGSQSQEAVKRTYWRPSTPSYGADSRCDLHRAQFSGDKEQLVPILKAASRTTASP